MRIASFRAFSILTLAVAGATSAVAAPSALADPWFKSAPVSAAAQAGCLDAPLVTMANSGVTGTARLCISDDGVQAQVASSNLAAANAYTAWFVYFDQPSSCQGQRCMPPDVIGDDPPGVLGRMDGLVADGSGAATFSGDYRGLRLVSGSEVHLPIFGHGPANTDDRRARARQLLTPEEPMLGAPGLGVPGANHAGSVAVAMFDVV